MLYTPVTKLALRICFDAHKDQVDKTGLPYVFHPFHLAEQMDTETEITAALLHDVVEDTAVTFEDLEAAGISEEVLEVLRLLTHPEGMAYMDYVRRLSGNPTARKIKLADLRHNGDQSRLRDPDPGTIRYFREKYAPAIALLERLEAEG